MFINMPNKNVHLQGQKLFPNVEFLSFVETDNGGGNSYLHGRVRNLRRSSTLFFGCMHDSRSIIQNKCPTLLLILFFVVSFLLHFVSYIYNFLNFIYLFVQFSQGKEMMLPEILFRTTNLRQGPKNRKKKFPKNEP